MANKMKVEGEEVVEKATFTKEQIVSSQRYMYMKDAINVVLKDGGSYSLDQVDDLIEQFMKGEVN